MSTNKKHVILSFIGLELAVFGLILSVVLVLNKTFYSWVSKAFSYAPPTNYLEGEYYLWQQGPTMSGTTSTSTSYDSGGNDSDGKKKDYCSNPYLRGECELWQQGPSMSGTTATYTGYESSSTSCPVGYICTNAGCMRPYLQTDPQWSANIMAVDDNSFPGAQDSLDLGLGKKRKKQKKVAFGSIGCGYTIFASVLSTQGLGVNPWGATSLISDSNNNGLVGYIELDNAFRGWGFDMEENRASIARFGQLIADTAGTLGVLIVNLPIGDGVDHWTLVTRVDNNGNWYLQDPWLGSLICHQQPSALVCNNASGQSYTLEIYSKFLLTAPPGTRLCL